jgi:hypothetical protein
MDGWTISFMVALAAAIIVTIYVIIKNTSEKEKTSPVPAPSPPEHKSIGTAHEAGMNEDTPSANVAIIYEGLRTQASKHCRFCGCEYALSAMICDICGKKL